MEKLTFSFIIPAKNEELNILPLYKELNSVAKSLKSKYEILLIDDGSTDNTFAVAEKIHKKDRLFKVIKHRGNFGKSIALMTGFKNSKGKIIFTLDADLQDKPAEIPKFIKKLNSGYDLVIGWKKKRYDPLTKVVPSRILNNILIPGLTGIRIHEINSGFKAYKRAVIQTLNLYGELYRFIPIFAARENFKIIEIPIEHRERKHGKSKYGWERNIKGLIDLITVVFLTGYLRRPGHFFGGLGFISFSIGFIIGIYIAYLRITTGTIQYRHPLLFFGMLLMIIGVQLISSGLLGEMITSSNQSKTSFDDYVERKLL